MRTTVTAALLAAATSAPAADVAIKPLVVLTGADSRTAQPTFARAADEAAFAKLWLGHLGKTADDVYREHVPAVEVDFDKCIVVALFHGTTTNSRGLRILSVIDAKETVTVRYERMSYQVSGPINGGSAPVNRVTPYAFVVLPKSAKTVVVEEDARHLKDQPPQWKERARLPEERPAKR